RRNRYRYAQWLATQDTESGVTPLSDEEFAAVYGPAPWQLLDETLQLIGLDYTFVPPIGIEENLMYAAELVHLGTQTQIKPEHLSSGEKTLLAVALSLYSGARLGEAIELPRVLLLDEADASLHPAMVRSLLQVVGGIFCERYGVKVIMTTHSPTTVALAPEESLYVMQRNQQPRLRKASRDEALSSLTVGIPTLSVTTENRRQVFVESEYDESCYQHLFRLLHAELATPFSLAFIASGKGGHGDAEAVKRLVQELRGSGNLSVWGVVDRDSRGGAPEGIVFNPDRYAIENLVLDPLAVGIFLLRRGQLKPEDLGLDASLRHFQFGATEAQTLSDAIVALVRESSDDASIKTVHYLGGFSTAQPMFWSETNGHDLEDRLCASYPALRADGKNLKSRVITEALADVPCYIPVEVVTLFQRLLAAAN
ncbi:MAG: hypothetical protein QOE84_3137, partial [Actinomycetota bacterium]|nr:hypothetical protein [Actinomycetota bacterium]